MDGDAYQFTNCIGTRKKDIILLFYIYKFNLDNDAYVSIGMLICLSTKHGLGFVSVPLDLFRVLQLHGSSIFLAIIMVLASCRY